MSETKELLTKAIVDEINNLRSCEPGTNEHNSAVDNVQTLYKLQIEEIKLENNLHELEYKADIDTANYNLAIERFEEEKKNSKIERYLKYGFEGLSIGMGCFWLKKGLKFEETGAFTSTIVRQHILPFMKMFRRR